MESRSPASFTAARIGNKVDCFTVRKVTILLCLAFAAIHSALGVSGGVAQEKAKPNFRHFTVKTDLQRRLLDDPAVADVVFIHGGSLKIKDGKIDEASLDFEALRKDLKDDKRKGGTLAIYMVIDAINDKEFLLNRKMTKEVQQLQDFAKSLGFDRYGGGDHGSISWDKLTSDVDAKPAGDENTKEDAVEKKGFSIYPVRTALSRFLTIDADCVVEIEAPVDAKWNGLFDPELFGDLNAAVDTLTFDAYDVVQFRVSCKVLPDKISQEFSTNEQYTAKSLGFRSGRTHHTRLRGK